MQKENLTYEWNDVALLTDQRAYTILCKTMLQIPDASISEVQEILLSDWTWQSESKGEEENNQILVPFRGVATLQILYLDQKMQQQTFFVDVPVQGAWQEPMVQQNNMRLLFYHTQNAEEQLLLETVLQINRNQPLERTQVLLGQFQMETFILLDDPWPPCDALLTTSVTLQITEWVLHAQQLQITGEYQTVCVYQSTEQIGEQVFVYEHRLPALFTLPVPDGLQTLDGMMPYYQSLTAQVVDTHRIQLLGNGVFCTLPLMESPAQEADSLLQNTQPITVEQAESQLFEPARQTEPISTKMPNPSVVNKRGSRREHLSKYMRDLNNSVETPTSIRNFEIGTEQDLPD